jgi:hypothetical protein
MLKFSEILSCSLIIVILLLIGLADPKLFHGNALSAMIFIILTLVLYILRRFKFINPIWKLVALFWMVLLVMLFTNYIIEKYFRKK